MIPSLSLFGVSVSFPLPVCSRRHPVDSTNTPDSPALDCLFSRPDLDLQPPYPPPPPPLGRDRSLPPSFFHPINFSDLAAPSVLFLLHPLLLCPTTLLHSPTRRFLLRDPKESIRPSFALHQFLTSLSRYQPTLPITERLSRPLQLSFRSPPRTVSSQIARFVHLPARLVPRAINQGHNNTGTPSTIVIASIPR